MTAAVTEPALGCVLVVDDEAPALDELGWLLGQDDRVGEVLSCTSAAEALRILQERQLAAVFLDVAMPGLSGLELAQVLRRFRTPPPVVFVTAHEDHAVQAFELAAVDYLLKPVRRERLAEAVRRVIELTAPAGDDVQIAVELGGVTRFIPRAEVLFVEAQGDYARLHTERGSHLLRTPLSALETEWAGAGFLRMHRSLLVAAHHVSQTRLEDGRFTVVVGGHELVASRRHARAVREALRAGHD